jgi:SAM-dependent methyltransferase
MSIGERILRKLSRDPDAGDYTAGTNRWTVDNALLPLRAEFPDLTDLVRSRRVLDFGCGDGWQAVALARAGAREVVGIDTNERTLSRARQLAERYRTMNVCFASEIPEALQGKFDVVISQNAMEHFADPEGVLRRMAGALDTHGRLLIAFGPPWFAPSGSHMHFFTRVPWVNVLFSEKTVMAVRALYRDDGARRYEEVESGLNRMTVRRFERLTARCGLRVQRRRYRCVKGISLLQWPPGLREFAINNIACVFIKS